MDYIACIAIRSLARKMTKATVKYSWQLKLAKGYAALHGAKVSALLVDTPYKRQVALSEGPHTIAVKKNTCT